MNRFEITPLSDSTVKGAFEIEKSSLEAPWSQGELELLINSETARYFVACDSYGRVCGIGGFYRVVDECMITNIAVGEEYRRQGLGSELLERILTEAEKLGCVFATLEVASGNSAAVSLYKGFGFETVGERKKYYKNDKALLMTKPDLGRITEC